MPHHVSEEVLWHVICTKCQAPFTLSVERTVRNSWRTVQVFCPYCGERQNLHFDYSALRDSSTNNGTWPWPIDRELED